MFKGVWCGLDFNVKEPLLGKGSAQGPKDPREL